MSDNSKPHPLLTVGELRTRLSAFPDDALVVLSCDDDYYSGPVSYETEAETAGLYGICSYQTPAQDAYGRSVEAKTRVHPGGWFILDDNHGCSIFADQPILERRTAFVIRNGDNNG